MKKFSVILVAVLFLSLSAVAQPPVPGETSTDDGEESQIPVPDESVEGPENQYNTSDSSDHSSDLEGNSTDTNEDENEGLLQGFFKMISLFF